MFSLEDYIKTVKQNLGQHSALITREIKKTINYNFYIDIDLVDYMAFIDPTRFEISIRMFSMDKEASEVFYEGEDKTIFSGSTQVIPDIKYFQLSRENKKEFDEFYENNDIEIEREEHKAFTEWFYECWKAAQGHKMNLPSYFVIHDDYKSLDLRANKWISDDEKWE